MCHLSPSPAVTAITCRTTQPSAWALRQTSGYLAVQLNAEKGPLDTKNYRIDLYAVTLPEGKTFIHLRYSYGYGIASKLAMQGYMATLGRSKIGFTQANGSYVTGMRGAVERNAMRYYLAIEAYLASLKAPAMQQFNVRLEHWFKCHRAVPPATTRGRP